MKTQLTKAEKSDLLPKIKRVLETGEPWEDGSLHHPADAITLAILSIEGMERAPLKDPQYGIEGFATNGWEWDWWQDFAYKGKRYTLSGSGFYGGHAFHIADE